MTLDTLTSLIAQTVPAPPTPDDPSAYGEAWQAGDAFTGLITPFTDLLGPLAPMMLVMGIAGIFAIISDGLVLPIVVMILLGGMMIPFLPAAAQMGAIIVVLLGVAGGLYVAWMQSGI